MQPMAKSKNIIFWFLPLPKKINKLELIYFGPPCHCLSNDILHYDSLLWIKGYINVSCRRRCSWEELWESWFAKTVLAFGLCCTSIRVLIMWHCQDEHPWSVCEGVHILWLTFHVSQAGWGEKTVNIPNDNIPATSESMGRWNVEEESGFFVFLTDDCCYVVSP